jgi:APA family basic amino acid/polyamine antiporter
MASLPWMTWLTFLIWLTIGLAIYFGYGRRHSVLRRAAVPHSNVLDSSEKQE